MREPNGERPQGKLDQCIGTPAPVRDRFRAENGVSDRERDLAASAIITAHENGAAVDRVGTRDRISAYVWWRVAPALSSTVISLLVVDWLAGKALVNEPRRRAPAGFFAHLAANLSTVLVVVLGIETVSRQIEDDEQAEASARRESSRLFARDQKLGRPSGHADGR